MRLIGSFSDAKQAERFSSYLKREGIATLCEPGFDAVTEKISYQCWVHDEDQIDRAEKDFISFVANPEDPRFGVVEEEPPLQEPLAPPPPPKVIRAPFTVFIIALCIGVFLLSLLDEYQGEGTPPNQKELLGPVEESLLFDIPPSIVGVQTAEQLALTSYWRGIYSWTVLKIQGKPPTLAEGPMFVKIRQGEVWRLISPVLMHGGFLHILFNMIWVWILSVPIEQRIGIFRLLSLSLGVGVVSNVAQYLMSGPFFLGYSGIVMGLVGFIWMRERLAPWEGYPLRRSTLFFLGLFIGGVFVLQCVAFILQFLGVMHFDPNIANTAHIVGGLTGALLGSIPFFSVRVRA